MILCHKPEFRLQKTYLPPTLFTETIKSYVIKLANNLKHIRIHVRQHIADIFPSFRVDIKSYRILGYCNDCNDVCDHHHHHHDNNVEEEFELNSLHSDTKNYAIKTTLNLKFRYIYVAPLKCKRHLCVHLAKEEHRIQKSLFWAIRGIFSIEMDVRS